MQDVTRVALHLLKQTGVSRVAQGAKVRTLGIAVAKSLRLMQEGVDLLTHSLCGKLPPGL